MNKNIIANILATLVIMLMFVAVPVFAAPPNGSTGPGDTLIFTNPIKATSLQEFLKDLLRVVTMLGAIVVVFFIILAGFNYVTARGDEKKIQSATKTLTWTAVGAAVILGAQVIATAIQGTVNQLGN